MNYILMSFKEGPFWIRVPKITRKEKLYLDSNMPVKPGWKPTDFGMEPEDVENYCQIYRFFPSFAELFI
jgi:hypothetical protein